MNYRTIIIAILLGIGICILSFCTSLSKNEKEHLAIKNIIIESYIKGFFLNRDTVAMNKGFHPEFNILMLGKENQLNKLSLEIWTEIVDTRLKDKKESGITYKFPLIDVSDKAAIVKIEIYKEGKILYTDYFSLYKFRDDWKIVNKIFNQH